MLDPGHAARLRVWGTDDVQERTVDSVVKRLRLGAAGGLIGQLRGVGYRLRADRPAPCENRGRPVGTQM
ncbi:MAG: hypothetical protein R3F59_08155 [Myxococcota bacterium]